MKVRLERSGGLAGLVMVAEVDTDSCSPELADRARQARQARLPVAAPSAAKPAPVAGADRYQYDLTFADGQAVKRVRFGEGEVPPALDALVKALLPLARPMTVR